MKIFGACGEENCTDCFPLFDENNKEVTDNSGYVIIPFEKVRITKDEFHDYPWQVDGIITLPNGKLAAYTEYVCNWRTWHDAVNFGIPDMFLNIAPEMLPN